LLLFSFFLKGSC